MIWLIEVRDGKIWSPLAFEWYVDPSEAQKELNDVRKVNRDKKFRIVEYVRAAVNSGAEHS